MLVSWTQQESAERDSFLVSETKAYFPSDPHAQEQLSPSARSPQPQESIPALCYTVCWFCDGPFLTLPCAQTAKVSRCLGQPLWHPHLGFCCSERLASAVGWHPDALAHPTQWLYLLFRFSPNKRCHLHHLTLTRPAADLHWKCLMAVFKVFPHNVMDKMLLCEC